MLLNPLPPPPHSHTQTHPPSLLQIQNRRPVAWSPSYYTVYNRVYFNLSPVSFLKRLASSKQNVYFSDLGCHMHSIYVGIHPVRSKSGPINRDLDSLSIKCRWPVLQERSPDTPKSSSRSAYLPCLSLFCARSQGWLHAPQPGGMTRNVSHTIIASTSRLICESLAGRMSDPSAAACSAVRSVGICLLERVLD